MSSLFILIYYGCLDSCLSSSVSIWSWGKRVSDCKSGSIGFVVPSFYFFVISSGKVLWMLFYFMYNFFLRKLFGGIILTFCQASIFFALVSCEFIFSRYQFALFTLNLVDFYVYCNVVEFFSLTYFLILFQFNTGCRNKLFNFIILYFHDCVPAYGCFGLCDDWG